MATRLWTDDGLPTELCIAIFTDGDCWALASEIITRAPLRMYLVDDGAHWVAGNGTLFLDIEGVHTRKSLLERWHAESITLADQDQVNEAARDCMRERYSFSNLIERADVVIAAERVIEAHSVRMGLEKR
jgi:hypothetical protein